MIQYLNSHLSIESVLILFPIIFMFHDFEEILTVEQWMDKHRTRLESILPKWILKLVQTRFHITTLHFAKNVFWIFLVISLVSVFTILLHHYSIFLILLAVFFFHAFTHLGQAIFLKSYTPGVTTSIFLIIPYSIYAYYRLLTGNFITPYDLVWSGLSILITMPLLFFILIKSQEKKEFPI